ncbi:MAG TPA: hypothetical protein PKX00_03365 [Opitutaceae bacterium]|nr:hypothetical protein [Opitutaceae bacterium]
MPPAVQTPASTGAPPPADLLRRVLNSADACFGDILRHGHITVTNAREYRRTRQEERAYLAGPAMRAEQPVIPFP